MPQESDGNEQQVNIPQGVQNLPTATNTNQNSNSDSNIEDENDDKIKGNEVSNQSLTDQNGFNPIESWSLGTDRGTIN